MRRKVISRTCLHFTVALRGRPTLHFRLENGWRAQRWGVEEVARSVAGSFLPTCPRQHLLPTLQTSSPPPPHALPATPSPAAAPGSCSHPPLPLPPPPAALICTLICCLDQARAPLAHRSRLAVRRLPLAPRLPPAARAVQGAGSARATVVDVAGTGPPGGRGGCYSRGLLASHVSASSPELSSLPSSSQPHSQGTGQLQNGVEGVVAMGESPREQEGARGLPDSRCFIYPVHFRSSPSIPEMPILSRCDS